MVIRSARPDDASAMARVMVDTFLSSHQGMMPEEAWNKRKAEWTYEVSARNWDRALREIAQAAHPRECIHVAEDASGEIVGLAMGVALETQSPDSALRIGEVCVLYVRQSWQGQGIGTLLVKAIATHLAQVGISTLHTAVLTANTPARRFYESLGGRVIGEREFDEEGFLLPEVVYGWAEISDLR